MLSEVEVEVVVEAVEVVDVDEKDTEGSRPVALDGWTSTVEDEAHEIEGEGGKAEGGGEGVMTAGDKAEVEMVMYG